MTDHITALAGTLAALARSGGTKLVNGITTSAVVSGVVQVDLGAGRIVPADVPGSFRANIVDGQKIKLLKNQTNNTYVVESVLTALTTPTVAAPPAASTIAPAAPPAASTISPGTAATCLAFGTAGYDNTGFTAQDFENAAYVEGHIRTIINSHRDTLDSHRDDLTSLKTTLNNLRTTVDGYQDDIVSLKTTVNSLRTTVDALRSALIAQGHVV